MHKVSIIIPTLNEEKMIGKTLEFCLNQSYPIHEILVIDANSTDTTVEKAKKFTNVNVVQHHPPVGGQRAKAREFVTGDILVFLDADVFLPPDFIAQAVSTMEKKSLDITCPIYWPYHSTIPIKTVYGFFNAMFVLFQHIFPSGAGSCIIVRKNLYDKVGGFEANLKFDDIAFIRKAARAGKFRMLLRKVNVSDRRFREYGTLIMLVQYLLLSVFFMLGLFKQANLISYKFGAYKKQ